MKREAVQFEATESLRGDCAPTSPWRRLTHGWRRIFARPDWRFLLGDNWAERVMQVEVTDQFHAKQGRSTGRLVVERDGQRLAVYLKRHYRLPRWAGWLASLWPGNGWSPAWQECRHLRWAQRNGLPVPVPVAAGEFVGPWGKMQSFLAIEELVDMLPLHQAIPRAARMLHPADFQAWKNGLVSELARLARELHLRRHFHSDLYLCHFFIRRDELWPGTAWRGKVHLIDLHRLAHHRVLSTIWRVKDLAQLLFSSDLEGIEARDRLRFWRTYLGAARRSFWGRWLAWTIRVKAFFYQRHNDKKRLKSQA
ncbi:MAG: lipopolysaccharide kinase [Planctomycetes bacterium]|nr:lipopolysaccharide kinase [Planctomycetota bacterium]